MIYFLFAKTNVYTVARVCNCVTTCIEINVIVSGDSSRCSKVYLAKIADPVNCFSLALLYTILSNICICHGNHSWHLAIQKRSKSTFSVEVRWHCWFWSLICCFAHTIDVSGWAWQNLCWKPQHVLTSAWRRYMTSSTNVNVFEWHRRFRETGGVCPSVLSIAGCWTTLHAHCGAHCHFLCHVKIQISKLSFYMHKIYFPK